jgi:hypothetical protein
MSLDCRGRILDAFVTSPLLMGFTSGGLAVMRIALANSSQAAASDSVELVCSGGTILMDSGIEDAKLGCANGESPLGGGIIMVCSVGGERRQPGFHRAVVMANHGGGYTWVVALSFWTRAGCLLAVAAAGAAWASFSAVSALYRFARAFAATIHATMITSRIAPT